MARPAEVFARELSEAEAQRLVKITRTTKDRVRLRRAGIVLASTQGRSATDAAAMFAMTAAYAREVIHAFNDQGFAALDPKWSGGRPRRFGPPGPRDDRSGRQDRPGPARSAVHDLEPVQARRASA
jgi:hypothetical protein